MRTTLLFSLIFTICSVSGQKQPPQAKQIEYADTLHGVVIPDPYKWMENLKSPELLKYVKAENKHTKMAIKQTKKLKKELYKEVVQRKRNSSLPLELFEKPDGEYIYYTRYKGKNAIHCRKKRDTPSSEEVLLDEKDIFAGKKKWEFEEYKISPDGKHIAYTLYNYYTDETRIFVINPQEPNITLSEIINAEFEKWINDSIFLYYKISNDGTESLYIHKLGTTQSTDKLIYEQLDKSFEYKSSVSNSKQYFFIEFYNTEGSEVHYLKADAPDELIIISQFEKGIHYRVFHNTNDTVFYIMTNLKAPNFKIVTTNIDNTDRKNWVDFLPESDNVILWLPSSDGDWLVLSEYGNGCMNLSIVDKKTGKRLPMDFDENLYTLSFIHLDTLNKTVRFMYESFITPETYYDYDIETHKQTKLYETQISHYNKSDYEMKFLYVPAHDGTQIPVTIVYNNKIPRDVTSPVLMEARGYGGNIDNIPFFHRGYLAMLDRGFYWVCPVVRGAGGSHSQRAKAGIGPNSKNRAHDMASVAQFLISEKYTSPEKIHALGESGGGIANGMIANMYPELFGSITLEVPVVDVIFKKAENYFLFDGNPNIKEDFDYMIEYSPYQNVNKQAYPAMLLITGLNDRNVPSYQTIKMAAKIRANNTGNASIYLSTDLKGDHYRINQKKTLLPFVFILALHYNIL